MKQLNIILLQLIFPACLLAQEWKQLPVDDIFKQAQQLAFDGKRDEARLRLNYILEKSPDYHDVKILIARTHAWDGNRAEARKLLQEVLVKSPTYEDAFNALIDVETWDDNYSEALSLSDLALATYPNNEDFLYKRAVALDNLNKKDEAVITLNRLLAVNPAHQQGLNLLKTIKTEKLKYSIGVNYSLDVFNRTFDPAHYASLQFGRINGWGTSTVRLNYANRFLLNGFQPEIDLYPAIAKGVYAYLNYGFSNTDLFPKHRIGGEVFSKLPKSLEASLGFRYLYFDSLTKVTIYTGSIGWYFKSYWISLRPYITPNEETGTSYSATLVLRKYFGNRDQYFGLSGGLGFSPDERRFQSSSGLTSDGIHVLRSQRFSIASSRELKNNIVLTAGLDFVHQELLFDLNEYVWITTFAIGVRKRF